MCACERERARACGQERAGVREKINRNLQTSAPNREGTGGVPRIPLRNPQLSMSVLELKQKNRSGRVIRHCQKKYDFTISSMTQIQSQIKTDNVSDVPEYWRQSGSRTIGGSFLGAGGTAAAAGGLDDGAAFVAALVLIVIVAGGGVGVVFVFKDEEVEFEFEFDPHAFFFFIPNAAATSSALKPAACGAVALLPPPCLHVTVNPPLAPSSPPPPPLRSSTLASTRFRSSAASAACCAKSASDSTTEGPVLRRIGVAAIRDRVSSGCCAPGITV